MRFFLFSLTLLLIACSSTPPATLVEHRLAQAPAQTELAILWLQKKPQHRVVSATLGLRYDGNDWLTVDNQQAVFATGSLTKLFTAQWYALRFADGSLQLEQHLGSLLPGLCDTLAELNLLQLLTHSSGLSFLPTDIGDMPVLDSNPFADYSAHQLQQYCEPEQQLASRQGRYHYSNLGYAYLAMAMQAKSGLDYEALVQAAIVQPLGLQHSSTERGPLMAQLVAGQNPDGSITPGWDFAAFTGSGGFYSSSHDLKRWLIQQLTAQSSAIRSMQYAHHPAAGLGWQQRHRGARHWLEQTGATGGYTAAMLLEPERQQAILVLSNLSGLHADAVVIAELAEHWLLQSPFMPAVDAPKGSP
ncbi:MAG: serine hydrolase [Alkalimonas sp.]|nr:serine hydrolase [Alkalimonas sp.]